MVAQSSAAPELTGVGSPSIEPGAEHSGARVARGATALLATQPLTWAASLSLAILVPRLLGDDGLGRAVLATTITSFIGLIASFGLPTVITRRVAAEPREAGTYAWTGVAVVTFASVVLNLMALGMIRVFAPGLVEPDLLVLAMIGSSAGAVRGILSAALIGQERHGRYAISNAALAVLAAAAGLGALALGAGPAGYVGVNSAVMVVVTAVVWAKSGLPFTADAVHPSVLAGLVRASVPLFGWGVALKVRGDIDVLLTGLLMPHNVVGWLAAAYRISGVTVFLPTAITTPLLPAFSRIRGASARYRILLQESLANVLFLTVPVSACIFVVAPAVPTLFGWPAGLERAVPVMRILAFEQPLIGVNMVLGASLMALGRERQLLKVALTGALMNPALNLIAIPLAHAVVGNGAIGAAIAELATEIALVAGMLRITPREYLAAELFLRAVRTIACGIGLLVVAAVLQPAGLPISLGGGGLAFLAGAWTLGILRRDQLIAVRSALRRAS